MTPSLKDILQDSLAQLKENPSDTNEQKVLLILLEKIPNLTQNLVIPNPPSPIRSIVFEVYNSCAKLLGRNTPEAIIADTAHRIGELSKQGILSYPPGRGRHITTTPEQVIDDSIKPLLDRDQQSYVWEVQVYSKWRQMYDIWNNRLSKLRKLSS